MHSQEQIDKTFSDLRTKREDAIQAKIKKGADRVSAAMAVDFAAPPTNGHKQLSMLGIDSRTATVEEIVAGLGMWNITVVGLDTHPAKEHRSLLIKMLDEEIALVPPNGDMKEFVDFSRSGTLGVTEVVVVPEDTTNN